MERKFLFLLPLFLMSATTTTTTAAAAAELQPYCHENVTSVVKTPVIRTRTVVQKPKGFFKQFKKSKTYTEEYVADEETIVWKLVTRCCDGFHMTALKLCVPECPLGCPRHAHCAAPAQCECAAGYVSAVSPIDGSHYCEPVCVRGCPTNGRCAEPNVCECERGFHVVNGNDCVARCSSGCPGGGRCVRPEVCECAVGYVAEGGTCRPLCTGDCQHGDCVAPDECVCHSGFRWDDAGQSCEAVECAAGEAWDVAVNACVELSRIRSTTSTTEATTSAVKVTEAGVKVGEAGMKVGEAGVKVGEAGVKVTEAGVKVTEAGVKVTEAGVKVTEAGVKVTSSAVESASDPTSAGSFGSAEAPEGFPEEQLDESEKIIVGPTAVNETAEPTTATEDPTQPRCPAGAIFYHGECRPELFPSDKHDCRRLRDDGCGPNARCQTNGSCVCDDGYGWHPDGSVCLRRSDRSEEESLEGAETEEEEGAWLGAVLLALGLGCIAGALLFLTVRLLRQQRGKLDVEGKSDLCCEYENKSFCESQMVL